MKRYTDEELDELVHDCFSQQASTLNNKGREAQTAFLTEQGIISNTDEA